MYLATGIIAEYNPFHNGHSYQLIEAKKLSGSRFAVVAMSGSFTQRGDIASMDKFTRARFALERGADMVVELPVLFSLAAAERFATGGVHILASSGLVGTLSFGAENADASLLREAAHAASDENGALGDKLSLHLGKGLSFPAARAAALADCGCRGDLLDALCAPNNILAVEYIKALSRIAPDIRPVPVKRLGTQHDAQGESDGFASASALRAALEESDASMLRRCMDADEAGECMRLISELRVPCSSARLSDILIYAVRRLSPMQIERIPDVAEGLENVIYREARKAVTAEELLRAIKSRRYTASRLRRILSCALLGITKQMHSQYPYPQYIRVLGVRNDAKTLLSALSERASLPVIACRADCDALDDDARFMLALDAFADDILAMASPSPQPSVDGFSHPLLSV